MLSRNSIGHGNSSYFQLKSRKKSCLDHQKPRLIQPFFRPWITIFKNGGIAIFFLVNSSLVTTWPCVVPNKSPMFIREITIGFHQWKLSLAVFRWNIVELAEIIYHHLIHLRSPAPARKVWMFAVALPLTWHSAQSADGQLLGVTVSLTWGVSIVMGVPQNGWFILETFY